MSDEKKPFAWCRQVGDETVVEFDNGIVAARFGCDVASQAGYTADAINAAVERERREAAVKALREAADWLIRFPHSASEDGKFATANAMLDGITVAVTGLRSCADKIERGEQ